MLRTRLLVFSDMQTHTSRYFIKTPVIQNTQIGWQAATCVCLRPSQTLVRRQDDVLPDRNELCVCKQPAGRQAAGGEPGRKSRAVGRQRYGASKSKEEKGRKANLSTLQTTSSAAWINTFTYRHPLGRHTYRQLSVTSVTSLYLSFFFPIFKAGKTERISSRRKKGGERRER